jgi:selenide,water dikinase
VGALDLSVLREILRGAGDKCVEARVAVVGGHSIDDKEPKFGLAVTGRVHPRDLWMNRGAQAGDCLVLTKPLGVGILTTGIKRGKLSAEGIAQVVGLMATLNRDAADAAREAGGIHAATDVTGYGLLGHLHEMAHASGLEAEVWLDRVPVLSPRVRELAGEGVVPGGSKRNLEFVTPRAVFDPGVSPLDRTILADAQTSGGLLLAVEPSRAPALVAALTRRGTPAAAVVGRFAAGPPGLLRVLPEEG